MPRLLHGLGFSVPATAQKLARVPTSKKRRRTGSREVPAIKKAASCRGVVMFGDEASFWLDSTLHRTWSALACSRGRDVRRAKDGHVYGAITLERRPWLAAASSPMCSTAAFLEFLKDLVRRSRRKIFLIIDNGSPCHRLEPTGCEWLAHAHRLELFRLPPYSPEFNGIEGVWKATKKVTTHNRFYRDRQRARRRCSSRPSRPSRATRRWSLGVVRFL
ncbi:MAG: transposase [Sandaracinus sp.]